MRSSLLLRLQLFEGENLLQEAAVHGGSNVTVGRSTSCTLRLYGDRIPDSFDVFLWEQGLPVLRFSEAMPGWVGHQNTKENLASLVAAKRTRRVQGFHLHRLSGEEFGQLQMGAFTLRFSLETRPRGGPRIPLGERALHWLVTRLAKPEADLIYTEDMALRVAVFIDNKIVGEQVLSKPSDITIGSDNNATLKVPAGVFPESFRLFSYRRGRYILHFREKMAGKVLLSGELLDLAGLQETIPHDADTREFPLSIEDRGKIVLGNVAFLFQFVTPPRRVATEEFRSAQSGFVDLLERARIWASVSSTGHQSRGVVVGLLTAIAGAILVGLGGFLFPFIEKETVQFSQDLLFYAYGWPSGLFILSAGGIALLSALIALFGARKKVWALFGVVASIGSLGVAIALPFVLRSHILSRIATGEFLETTQVTMDTGYLLMFVGAILAVIGFVRAMLASPTLRSIDRILQCRYFWQDQLVNELLFPERRDVLVGLGRHSDLVLPVRSSRLRHLFRVDRRGDYWLALLEGMDGILDVAGERQSVQEFIQEEGARVGGISYVHVRPGDSGILRFGSTTLKFSFVPPPMTMVGRPSILSFDGALAASTLSALFAVMVFYVVSSFLWDPQVAAQKASERRSMTVQMDVTQELEEQRLVIGETDGEGEGDVVDRFGNPDAIDEEEQRPASKPRAPETEADRQKRQIARVQNTTILKYLGSSGGGTAGGRSMTAVAGMGDAWSMGNPMAVVQEGGSGTLGSIGGGSRGGMIGTPGGGSIQKMASSDMKGSGRLLASAKQVGGADKVAEVAVKMRVSGTLGSQAGMGKINRQSVESVFRRRQGAIRSCYERALKVNPQIEGKVVIRFTIGGAGTVTEISVTENTTSDTQIGQCIIDKVRTWPFPPPQEGSVTFVYPFMLTSGG